MFYYIVFIDHCTAVYKYSKYDAEIINISPHQSRQIKGYDFVDNFITYIDISHVKLINSTDDSSLGTLLKVFRSNSYKDIDYTPFSQELVVESDFNLLNNTDVNPIFLSEIVAKELNLKVGDKVIADFSDMMIEYTLIATYEEVLRSSGNSGCVFLTDSLQDWLLEGDRKINPDFDRDDEVLSHGYITFNDKNKGHEFLKNFYSDIVLYEQYGEDWLNKASDKELEYNIGEYFLRDIEYKVKLKNLSDDFNRVVILLLFALLALVIFIVREQNKVISSTIQAISILIANGCRKMGFFVYFLVTTFVKYFIYFFMAMMVFKYFIINEFNGSLYMRWRTVVEVVPVLAIVALVAALIVSIVLYYKLKKKVVLFTGEE